MKMDRYEFLFEHISKVQKCSNLSAIDCGCSDGRRSSKISDRFKHYQCFDVDESSIKSARRKGLNVQYGNILQLPVDDKSSDVFICSETLEHLSMNESLQAAKEIMRVTRQIIAVTVPENKKICLSNKNHKQYLSKDKLISMFRPATLIWSGVYWKKPGRGNTVVIFTI